MKKSNYYLFVISVVLLLFNVRCIDHSEETIIYLVRHAEKDTTDQTKNPPLTEEGKQRAEKLTDILAKYKIEGIYSTKYDRNINTVRAIAENNNIEIQNYEWYNWKPLLREVKSKKGIYLICGHGDIILPMIDFLNGEKPLQELGHHEYDNLFKIIVEKDTAYIDLMKF